MPEPIEKAVWLPDLLHVRNLIRVLGQVYDPDTWVGGMVFTDTSAGFLFIATFAPDAYQEHALPFETLVPENQLSPITLEQACAHNQRYQPWLRGEICNALRTLRLLPA